MRVNIKPYWKRLANWYWDTLEGKTIHESGMSIWEMLEQDYGVKKGYTNTDVMYAIFPDEKMYAWFLLKWS